MIYPYIDRYLNKEFDALEDEYERIYGKADKAVRKHLRAYLRKHSDFIKDTLKRLKNGDISHAEYKRQIRQKVYAGKEWECEKFELAMIMYDADEEAIDYMNRGYDRVYEHTRNLKSYEIEMHYRRDLGLKLFALYMLKKAIDKKKLDKTKDIQWNQRNIQTAVEKNIDSKKTIKIMAKDVSKHVTNKVKKFNGRYAQYSTWSQSARAEFDTLKEAEDRGIETKKQWIATLDNHTRDLHRGLDGQIKPMDEPFEIDGYEIMYPHEQTGDPEMWINCRCKMGTLYPKYSDILDRIMAKAQRRENIKEGGERKIIPYMNYTKWEDYKRGGGNGS